MTEPRNQVTNSDGRSQRPIAERRTWVGAFARWTLFVLAIGIMAISLLVGGLFWWQTNMVNAANSMEIPNRVVERSPKDPGVEVVDEPLPGILAGINDEAIAAAEHPLDPLLDVARRAREKLLDEVADYSAVMTSEVRLQNGKLREPQVMEIKIRHPRDKDGQQVPFSIYSNFISPASMAGQEAIWVEGRNDGNLVGHPAGVLNWKSFWLDPTGSIAMNGNRHPIFEMGIERLLNQILEKGIRDRQSGDCKVIVDRGIEVNDVSCLRLTILHEKPEEVFDFHKAVIYVDIEKEMPIGYEAFLWPENPGEPLPLIERYFYADIRLNQGFTDEDFDPANENYRFPGQR